MRHTRRFVHSPTFIDRTVSCVSIRLQRALELAQVGLGMFALAIRRVGEPHCWGGSDLPKAGHPAHTSTIVPFWFCHCLVPSPARACRRRSTSWRSSLDVSMLLPRAPV